VVVVVVDVVVVVVMLNVQVVIMRNHQMMSLHQQANHHHHQVIRTIKEVVTIKINHGVDQVHQVISIVDQFVMVMVRRMVMQQVVMVKVHSTLIAYLMLPPNLIRMLLNKKLPLRKKHLLLRLLQQQHRQPRQQVQQHQQQQVEQ
jgi:hypothetical protein